MKDLQSIKDELNEFAPELSRMKKQNGFEVPPRYFDRLGDDIIRQMKTEEAEKQVVTKPWFFVITDALQSLLQPRLAMALAAMVLLLIGTQQFISDEGSTDSEIAAIGIEDLSDEDLNNYLADNSFDFEEDLLLDQEGDFLGTEGDEDLNKYFEEFGEELDLSNIEDLL